MNRSSVRAAALGFALALSAGCAKTVELRMAVEVTSAPEKAKVRFKGKDLGETPQRVEIKTFEDLETIVATSTDLDVVEKRIRIMAPDQAQVIFRMGKGEQASPVAKKLGIERILIFDYSEKVSFDSAKFDLKPDALPILNKQADILNQFFPKAVIHICGYTDATGGDDFNLKLSLKRAEAVTNYLLARGVAKERVQVHGFGKEYPVDNNNTPTGRALNRRTEIALPQ